MPTVSNQNRNFRKPVVAACLGAFFTLIPVRLPAQTPTAQAWSILQAGAADGSSEHRIATMRVLQLLPGDAKAVGIAENGLRDSDPDVRGAAALSLGAMKSKSAIPQLVTAGKSDTEGAVVMAVGKALIELGDERGYSVYYAVLTGQRKSGEGLVGSQEEEMKRILRNPKQMEDMAFEQGMGFVPFGGAGLKAYEAVRQGEENELMVKATSIKILAKDPDPRTTKALVAATTEKEWLLRSAAFDALARRDDRGALPSVILGLTDEKQEVQLTAAAAVISLSRVPVKSAH
ncbi:MAG: HEAT repeat domain-containing protein [Candidatus Acidiferrales bacterium]